MINNKNLVWYKFFANTFEKVELQQLMGEEGATGAGTFMIINEYLFNCDNAVGSLNVLSRLAIKCHKSKAYLQHVLRDYGLYEIRNNRFECLLLNKYLGICEQKSRPKHDNHSCAAQPEINQESISEPPSHHSTTCVRARIEENRKEKENPSTPSVVEGKVAGEGAFSEFWDEIFADPEWLASVSSQRGIALDKPPVLETVKQAFRLNCIANNRLPGHDGFDLPSARRYCYRWLNNSHENRRQLDRKIREQQRSLLPAGKRVSDYDEKLGYGYLIDGCRYSLYGDIVPLNAPPCRDRNQKWNPQTKKWE
jgi:hypothetical protein